MRLVWVVIPLVLFTFAIIGIQNVDARCPGGHPECGPPWWNRPNITNLDGWSMDHANVNEQYLITIPLRNYVWIFEPCNEYETYDAISLGEYNKTIPMQKCVSGGEWVLDESINDHGSSPVLLLVQINDENDVTQYLAWIEADVPPNDEKSFEFSWTPKKSGQHTIMTFVWESFKNPVSLQSPSSITLDVSYSSREE